MATTTTPKTKTLTPFEEMVAKYRAGEYKPPVCSVGTKQIDPFLFQFISHKYWMGIFAAGMVSRQIKYTTLKKYYGLKGRSAKDGLEQFKAIQAKYEQELANASQN